MAGSGWVFRSGGYVEGGREALERFPLEIEGALRAASRGSGAFRWRIETGPYGRAVLLPESPAIGDWIRGVLLRAYPPDRWQEGAIVPALPAVTWPGRAAPDPIGPFRSISDGLPPWIEPVLASTPLLPAGLVLDLELEPLGPLGPTRPREPIDPLVAQPTGFRAPLPAAPRRTISDRLEERRLGSPWSLRARLEIGPAGEAAADRLSSLLAAASRRDGGSGLEFRRPRRWWGARPSPILLSASEVAMLLPRPSARFLPWSEGTGDGAGSLEVGRTTAGRPARLRIDPEQGRHLAILGETGMGKSTLAVHLALQAARSHGLLLFDPIGDTARAFLAGLPPSAMSRVLWVAPGRSPAAINALERPRDGGGREGWALDRSIDDVVQALRRVRSFRYGETPFWGPRIEETVRRALTVAAGLPRGTFVDAARLLSSSPSRPTTLPPEVRDAYAELRARIAERPEEVDGARRLLAEVVDPEVLRQLLCEPAARTSVAEWVAPGRLTVISGEAPVIGETSARYLLAILLALVWPSLLARRPPSKCILLLDEAQWYAHGTVAEVLRLGRRANVHLWTVTHDLASLPDPVAEAARTNVADLVLFRGSPEEAREVHRWAPGVSESSLMSLRSGHALLLGGKGEEAEWTSVGRSLPRRTIPEAELEAIETSRRAWPEVPSGPPAEAGPEAAPGSGNAPASVQRILAVLRAGAETDPRAGTLLLDLTRARRVLDPDGGALRITGALLARAGVLRRRRDGPDGPVWELDRAGLTSYVAAPDSPTESSAAASAWRALGVEGPVPPER